MTRNRSANQPTGPAPPGVSSVSARVTIEALRPCVTPERYQRMTEVSAQRTRSIVPVLEGLVDPHNISAVLRSAEAVGLQEVHVVPGERGFEPSKAVSKGAQKWLDIVEHPSAPQCVRALRARGYRVFAASMEGSRTPESLRDEGRVAVVFGHEHRGVSGDLRQRVDGTFAVPMHGFVESLNVSVAAAVTFYALRAGRTGDLSEAERDELAARWLKDDVRDAERIIATHAQRRSRPADG